MDYAELKELQVLPLEYKVMITKQRIQEWYEHWEGQIYVSFSGGKDSTVLLHIVRELYPEVPAVFVDTGLEYPEIRQFVKSVDNVVWLKPKMTFKQVVENYGYPVVSKKQANMIRKLKTMNLSDKYRNYILYGDERGHAGKLADKWHYLIDAPFAISEQCCDVMKKEPFSRYVRLSERQPLIGIIAEESDMRTQQYIRNGGCNAFHLKKPMSTPLGFWTEQNVLEYLSDNNLAYASVYGKICNRGGQLVTTGVKRTGCMFCMFGVHMEQEPNRFQRMQISHPKLWEYCVGGGEWVDGKWLPSKEGLGIGFVLDYIHVPWKNKDDALWTTKELIEM